MSDVARQPVMSHWSKDFVEHLRTVHFSLITVSAALILFAYSHKNVNFPRAFAQASQMYQLREQWSKVQESLYTEAVRANKFRDHEHVFFLVKSPFISKRTIIGKLDIDKEQFAKYSPWKFSKQLEDPPETLADFRGSWNTLQKGLRVTIPIFKGIDEPSHGCNLYIWWRLDNGSVDHTVRTKFIYGHDDEDADRLEGFLDFAEDRANGSCEVLPITLQESTSIGSIAWEDPYRGNNGKDYIRLNGEIDLPAKAGMVARGHKVKTEELHFELLYDVKLVSIDEQPLGAMFREAHNGKFENAFPELAAISDDLMQINLKDVPERIRYMESQGEQSIEVFGLRVKAAQVSGFGAILLIAVQLYFWLHLHELVGRIDPSAPGWDVAWIGVYSSWPSVIALFLSSCVLPFIAAIVIGPRIRNASPQGPSGPHPWMQVFAAGAVYLLSGGLAAATVARIIQLRRGRDRLLAAAEPQPHDNTLPVRDGMRRDCVD